MLQHDVVAFQKELARGKPEGPGARPNIGISASAGAGAGIGAKSSQRGANAPRPAPAARPTTGAPRQPVRSPYAAPASSGFSTGAAPADRAARPARPARPERIRPTAAMVRGDVTDPWAKPDARGGNRAPATHHARQTGTVTGPTGGAGRPYARQERADRGEELSTSPKIKHFRAAKPPRERAAPTRIGSGAAATPRRADTPQRQDPPRGFRPQADDSRARSGLDKRAARSAAGRPGADPRPTRDVSRDTSRDAPARPERGGRPAGPGKGPSGGRGHPPRAPRGGKR